MADTTLGADSARENPNNAFVHARAVFEMASADLRQIDGERGTPVEVIEFYCDAWAKARDSMLLTPAHDIQVLARKLEAFRDEGCYGSRTGEVVLDALIADARRLAGEA